MGCSDSSSDDTTDTNTATTGGATGASSGTDGTDGTDSGQPPDRKKPDVDCTAEDNPPKWLGTACVVDSACTNACHKDGLCRRMAANIQQECTLGCRDGSDCPTGYSCRDDACNQSGETTQVCMRTIDNPPTTCSLHEDCGECGTKSYCVPTLTDKTKKLCRDECKEGSCPKGYTCSEVGIEGIPAGVKICRPTG